MTVKKGGTLDDDVFWGAVSDLMGNKRNRQQCRIKWYILFSAFFIRSSSHGNTGPMLLVNVSSWMGKNPGGVTKTLTSWFISKLYKLFFEYFVISGNATTDWTPFACEMTPKLTGKLLPMRTGTFGALMYCNVVG